MSRVWRGLTWCGVVWGVVVWWSPSSDAAQDGELIHGRVDGRTRWSGRVELDGDVEIPAGAELVIDRGTEVVVHGRDVTRGGFGGFVELRVEGSLRVLGTEDAPVRFVPAGPHPLPKLRDGYTPKWHGIVLLPGAEGDVRSIEWAQFHAATSAVQVPKGEIAIRHCLFAGCGTGVEVGSAWASPEVVGVPGGVARVAVEECRFVKCWVSVYTQQRGRPEVVRCVFHQNHYGVANRRNGVGEPIEAPGVLVRRCTFVENREAVQGPGRILDSIFVDNDIALRPSGFHHELATLEDFLVYDDNLFFGDKQKPLFGEAAVGTAYDGDPEFVDVASLETLWPPVPDGLALTESSAARGKAADGGDLGATGDVGDPDALRVWRPEGRIVRNLLVLGGGAGPARESPPTQAEAGRKVEEAWWARVDADDDGTLTMPRVLARGRGWVAFPFKADDDVSLALELNGDVRSMEAWLDGASVASSGARRFAESGVRTTVDVSKGTHTLLVYVEADVGDARLGVALSDGVQADFDVPKRLGTPSLRAIKLVTSGNERFLELRLSKPLHWDVRDHGLRAQILTTEQKVFIAANRLEAVVEAYDLVRVGPLPRSLTEGQYLMQLFDLVHPSTVDYDDATRAKRFKVRD